MTLLILALGIASSHPQGLNVPDPTLSSREVNVLFKDIRHHQYTWTVFTQFKGKECERS